MPTSLLFSSLLFFTFSFSDAANRKINSFTTLALKKGQSHSLIDVVLSSQNSIKKKFSHIEDEKMKKKNVFVQIQKTEIINLKLAIEVAIISLANDEFLLEFKIYCRFSRIKPE